MLDVLGDKEGPKVHNYDIVGFYVVQSFKQKECFNVLI